MFTSHYLVKKNYGYISFNNQSLFPPSPFFFSLTQFEIECMPSELPSNYMSFNQVIIVVNKFTVSYFFYIYFSFHIMI